MRICATCGRELFNKNAGAKYCSKACANKAHSGTRGYSVPPSRKCHDCGKPTNNYRCDDCNTKHKIKYNVSLHDDFQPDIYRAVI